MEQYAIDLRPRKLSEVFGHEATIKAITKQANKKNWPKSILLEGPTGVGKTTVAQIIAMMINCTKPEENGDACGKCASCRSIIEERFDGGTVMLNGQATSKMEVVDFVSMASQGSSLYSKNNIFIIEEADGLSEAAKKAMWKALEHPSKNNYFILLSMTYLGKATVDRCRRYNFFPFGMKDLLMFMKKVLEQLGQWGTVDKSFYLEVLPAIADYAQGSIRACLTTIENCLESELYTLEQVRSVLKLVGTEDVMNALKSALDIKPGFFAQFELLDPQEFFNRAYSALADGAVFRVTQQTKDDYFKVQTEELSKHINLLDLLKVFDDVHMASPYLKKSFFLSRMTQFFFSKKAPRRIVED